MPEQHKIFLRGVVNMKKYADILLHRLPALMAAFLMGVGLIMFPKEAAGGVREGLILLGQTVIPSLFPFLVLSSYITLSPVSDTLSRIFGKAYKKLFKVNEDAVCVTLMGLTGGFPVGAKIAAELYSAGRITRNEAERLLFWSVGAGPAFTVSAVGIFMLGSMKAGLILYASSLLASISIGFFCRFLANNESARAPRNFKEKSEGSPLVAAVSNSTTAMLGISAWVLAFSCLSSLINVFPITSNAEIFLKAVLEVTTGCRTAAGNVSFPVMAAIIGFGGFSVICQISPYLDICKIQMRRFISARIINSALSAFFASILINFFPEAASASTIINAGETPVYLSYTVPATAVLLIMCAVFIFEVDNKRKVC